MHKNSKETLKTFGFRQWDERGLMLIPGYRLKRVPKDFILTSIRGTKKRADEVDTEERMGLLAWGVTPEEYDLAVRWFR